MTLWPKRYLPRLLSRRAADPQLGEAGQALPLAAIGIFTMVLGVMATLNLGHAVHQKIKLQNTADAAAYTLAAMEARTFNYLAFLNRAQIAHYNTAMVVQSYITWVGFQVAAYGTAVDLLTALKNAIDTGYNWGCPYAGCPYIPLKAIISLVQPLAKMMRKFAVFAYKTGGWLGHKIVDAMSIFNKGAVWLTQVSRAALLNAHILTGMQSYIEKHDKDISFSNGKSALLNYVVNTALNSIEYYQAFDNASGMNPYIFGLIADIKRVNQSGEYTKHSDDKAKDAYRLMAELCQASRTPQFVSNRQESFYAMTMPPFAFVTGSKLGQTKFTEKGDMSGAEIKPIGNEGNYPMAAYLSSDDFAQNYFGTATLLIANAILGKGDSKLGDAIAAYSDGGKHYLYKGGSDSGTSSPGKVNVFTFPMVTGSTSETMETKSGSSHAPWPGFAPYFKFKPNKERTSDFNQPSSWIFLNKHHKDFQSKWGSHADGKAPWYEKFSWTQDGQTVSLDTTIGGSRNSYLFEGINVLSRGMAYYHRPDNWVEHPNFFNPFWRAKLAPVGQKLQNFWDRYVTQKITTKSDNAVIKAAVNLLRNAQMDLFTALITSIITH